MTALTATQGSGSGKQFLALDGWRGICAVLVAAMHFSATSHVAGLPIVAHAHLFVDFFFVLSGFVITHAYVDRLQTGDDAVFMLWRRLGRLWPLHLAVLAGFIALELIVPIVASLTGVSRGATSMFDPDSSALLSAVPTHVFLLQGFWIHDGLTWNVPSWSIGAEFWTYVVFTVVVIATRGRTVAVAVAVIALAAMVVMIRSRDFMATEHEFGFYRCLFGFFAGHLIYRATQLRHFNLPMPNLLEGLTVVGLLAFVSFAGKTPFEFAAPIVLGIVVWVFAHEQGAISTVLKLRPLQLVGLWSYSIYMVHSLVIAVLHRMLTVMERVSGEILFHDVGVQAGSMRIISIGNAYVMDVVTVLYLALVIGLSSLTWRWIEMPSQRAWNGKLWASLRWRNATAR